MGLYIGLAATICIFVTIYLAYRILIEAKQNRAVLDEILEKLNGDKEINE